MDADVPIGQHLRQADRVITAHLAHALAQFGLTRFSWQVLNVLARGVTDREALAGSLRLFSDPASLATAIDDLRGRGWVGGDEQLTLTDAGREGHRTAAARVGAVRDRSMRGVSQQDYVLVLTTLDRMVRNLEVPA